MRNSIKLLAIVSTILSANVFAAETAPNLAESHRLTSSGFVFTKTGGVTFDAPDVDTVSVRCAMNAECGNGDRSTYELLDTISKTFEQRVRGSFPKANLIEAVNVGTVLFEDVNFGKWQGDKLDDTASYLTGCLNPFIGDLYDMALMVKLFENGQPKQVVFLSESHGQVTSIDSLIKAGIDARPISELKKLVPTSGFEGRQILESSLVIRIGTHEYTNKMLAMLNGGLQKGGLGGIVLTPNIKPYFNTIELLTMQTGPWLHPKNAEEIEKALNEARVTLRGAAGRQKVSLGFRDLSVVSVKSDGTTKKIFSGEYRK